MLKRIATYCLFLVIQVFAFSGQPMAASVDVAGDCYYLANDNLTVTSLTSGTEVASFGDADGVNNATEVVVKYGKAIVTMGDTDARDAVVIDISGLIGCWDSSGNCFSNEECREEQTRAMYRQQYQAKFKQGSNANYLEIPGVEYRNRVYSVTMEQNRNSDNWEVSFVEEVFDGSEDE